MLAVRNDFNTLKRRIIEAEFSRLNAMQKKAVFQTEGPLLILAGAGSGKTTVVVNRIANIIKYGNAYNTPEDGDFLSEDDLDHLEMAIKTGNLPDDKVKLVAHRPAKPWQVLAITFTNKAAGELKERLSSILGEETASQVWASTFHSFCAKIMRIHAEVMGYTSSFTVYDSDDSQRMLKEIQKLLHIDDKTISYKYIQKEISNAKNQLISYKDYKKKLGGDYRKSKIAAAYEIYQRRLLEANAMDFDDLIYNTVLMFETYPEILEHYLDKFKYISVDEYQDTNFAQFRLVQLLAERHRNICVVGDDDQSIYKFRGADISNILNFERVFPNASIIRLEQNYRSTQNILSAANSLIEKNSQRKGKTIWTENDAGNKVRLHTAINEQDEAQYIAERIQELVKNGGKYSDHAVLYRMNAQSSSIERHFARCAIPYRIFGGHRFYERKEIKDAIAYLSVINNTSDTVRLKRIINEPKRSIGDRSIAIVTELAEEQGIPAFEVISHAHDYAALSRSAEALTKFSRLIQKYSILVESGEISLQKLYESIIEESGYLASLVAKTEENKTRIENIRELASNIARYEEENGEDASLQGFLEEVALLTDIDNYNSETDAVVMMTIHAAKGLEFPVVFLPGVEEGIFPGFQSVMDSSQIEEERRLAYVAVTRAKKEMYLIHADGRLFYGTTQRNALSRFAREISKEYVERSSSQKFSIDDMLKAQNPKNKRVKKTTAIEAFKAAQRFAVAVNDNVSSGYNAGEMVSHKIFGEGMVISAQAMGNDTLLEIAFEQHGTKKIMANFAKLTKM